MVVALDSPVRHEPIALVASVTLGYVSKAVERASIANRGIWRFLDAVYDVLVAGYGDVGICLHIVSPKVDDSGERYASCSVIEAMLLETVGQCFKVRGSPRLALR